TFLTRRGHINWDAEVVSLIPPLSLNEAFVNIAQGYRLAPSNIEQQAREMNEPGTRNDGGGLSCVIWGGRQN
ncbi:uncharacterized protein TrAFT101_001444, partial [Trichoderma asperellum]|uniref:uncharacterized protein n=1 Tax=Trichoderma asperellum TaxID=101201 RepID=UPI003321BBC7